MVFGDCNVDVSQDRLLPGFMLNEFNLFYIEISPTRLAQPNFVFKIVLLDERLALSSFSGSSSSRMVNVQASSSRMVNVQASSESDGMTDGLASRTV
ncbi:hypothetical protein TNCV_1860051 [Trichonephila clavipes]|nr:hypothetical protein TNCV_1860051 [Trichonephila clavipes]